MHSRDSHHPVEVRLVLNTKVQQHPRDNCYTSLCVHVCVHASVCLPTELVGGDVCHKGIREQWLATQYLYSAVCRIFFKRAKQETEVAILCCLNIT